MPLFSTAALPALAPLPVEAFHRPLRRDRGLFAAIDLGSQANLLLIGRLKQGVVQTEYQGLVVTGTGAALRTARERQPGEDPAPWASGRIGDDLLARLRACMLGFKDEIKRRGATLVAVGATSAYRQSANGREVLLRLGEALHFPCRLLTGDEEAELARAGAFNLYPDPRLSVFDLGGGSTEVTWVGGRHSVALGALTTAQAFDDEPDRTFTTAMLAYRKALAPVLENRPVGAGNATISAWPVLVGGTALALGHLECGLRAFDPEGVEGCRLSLAALRDWVRLLRGMSLREREALPGLDPGRAGILLSGTILALALAEVAGAKGFILSGRGLRYGLLLDGARRMGVLPPGSPETSHPAAVHP